MTYADEFHVKGEPKLSSVKASMKRATEHLGDDIGVVRTTRQDDVCRVVYKKGARNASADAILFMLSPKRRAAK